MSELMPHIFETSPEAFEAIRALREVTMEVQGSEVYAERLPALEALELHGTQLRDLNRRSLAPNLLFETSILAPALKFLSTHSDNLEVVLAWQGHQDKKLVGWIVVNRARVLPGIGLTYLKTWRHLYSYMGHPIVDRNNAQAALSALFDQILSKSQTSRCLMISDLPGTGPIFEAVMRVAQNKGLSVHEVARHERAAMITNLSGEEYLKSALSTKKRKEFRRLKNRLGDLGDLEFEIYQAEDDIGPWIQSFLDLEAAGWKGRKQTAFSNRENWAAFLKESTTRLAENGQCKIWRLTLDGKTIAITIAHHSGHQSWLTKITYDEAYSKFSPGVLLVLEVTKIIADDPVITELDSLATPDHPMINHLWREKKSTTNILIGECEDSTGIVFGMICKLIDAHRNIRQKTKSIYHRYLKGSNR